MRQEAIVDRQAKAQVSDDGGVILFVYSAVAGPPDLAFRMSRFAMVGWIISRAEEEGVGRGLEPSVLFYFCPSASCLLLSLRL